jgi:hypothetical protein
MQISESVPYRISTKFYPRRTIHGTYGKFHLRYSEKLLIITGQYGWKLDLPYNLWFKYFILNFNESTDDFMTSMEKIFMTFCNLNFLMKQYDWKSELPNNN